jgi:uncharacterized protein YyaL (SSP411 family)
VANRLVGEKSPYLLQHVENAVDWYPWGPEALRRARDEDKPILVSIGYSACHWCHVMAHESFEDVPTARLMNDHFVNIKVDREERPDVDAVYMEAVQMLTGQGGWPLNVFLTPDGRPFYGGTYFPPQPRHGLPSWQQVLQGIAEAYRSQRQDVLSNAAMLTDYVQRAQNPSPSPQLPTTELLKDAFQTMVRQFDMRQGGFGGAPKFPQPLALDLVLRLAHRFEDERGRQFVELTLRRMAEGGIFDQLGGGFHRYSVDDSWVVPHFEKMLYDNALLVCAYLHAFQLTHDAWYRGIAEQTLDYLLREMRSPEGGFYSAEDADSDGVEGKYYIWTPQEIRDALDPIEADVVLLRHGITEHGNFEGRNILTVAMSVPEIADRTNLGQHEVEQALGRGRQKLLKVREQRVAPGKDRKILTSWNALALRAFAEAGRILHRPDYLQASEDAAQFILGEMRPVGRLVRSYKDGPSDIPAFLEDYGFLVEALLALYETAFTASYLETANELVNTMVEEFWEDAPGAFFDAPAAMTELPVRPRSFFDNPIPSGNSAAAFGLLRLGALTGESQYTDRALPAFRAAADLAAKAPTAVAYLLSALDFYLSPQTQVAILGDPGVDSTWQLVDLVYGRYLPNTVLAVGTDGNQPLLAGRQMIDDRPTAYVCEHFACQLPVTDVEALALQLDAHAT